MFSNLDLLLNNIAVNNHRSHYGLKSYIITLLNNSNITKAGELQGAGYYPDTAGRFDTFDSTHAG
jgi:hypothetical protein